MYRPRINLHSWSAVLLLLQEIKSWTWRTNWRNFGNSAQIISGSQSPSLRKIKEDASRMPKNRCVLFDSFTYIYSALLPQHWALYAKVDSTPTFVYIYIFFIIFFSRGHGNESCNLIGSLPDQYFPISSHGQR